MIERIAIILVLLLTPFDAVLADPRGQEANPKAAEDAKYICKAFKRGSEAWAEVKVLHAQLHDKNALACAADYAYALALDQRDDIQVMIDAVDVQSTYLDHVMLLMSEDLGGQQKREWEIRLESAIKQTEELLAIMRKQWSDHPEVRAIDAVVTAIIKQNEDPVTTIIALTRSRHTLEEVVAEAPAALHGYAAGVLGRMYFDLPTFLGGDPVAAVKYLEIAHETSPKDLVISRWLVEALEAELEEDRTKAILVEMTQATADEVGHQNFADGYLYAHGIASRMGWPELASEFKTRRDALLSEHPELLTHQVGTAIYHSGTNPLTGE